MSSIIKECKVLLLTGYGGYDKMKVVTQEAPKFKADEVLINIKATGINFAELMARQGTYSTKFKLPAVLGFEGAGDIVEAGADVKTLKVGDRVLVSTSGGMWAEYAAINERFCFPIPAAMSYEEAAAIPVNYITAYHMLFEMGNLRKGKSVLIHMVAGGVGNAATQLCRSVPDVTIFGTCSAPKHDFMRKAGVDHPIDYRTKDYAQEIRKIAPKGVDIVLDPLNGDDAVKSYNLLKPLGTIIHFGAANIVTGTQRSIWQAMKTYWYTQSYNSLRMITSNKCVAGYHLGFLEKSPEIIIETMQTLLQMFTDGKIKPQIDSVWALEDYAKAMDRMHNRKNVGKVIMCPQAEKGSTDIRSSVDI